jgi:UDP-N-acetylglucosamine 1-carboxyvinyltransferase
MTVDAWRIVGGTPLRGRVRPPGSKNGALPSLAAALLLEGKSVFHNVPRIDDVHTMLELLTAVGMQVEVEGNTVAITNTGITTHRAPGELVGKMRASHYLLGPTLAKLGRAELAQTGGCNLGERPLGYIIDALAPLGVTCLDCNDRVEATTAGLVGARVVLDPKFRSPGATFTVLMAAALATGVTTIEHACYEPDVVALCALLTAAGAHIEGAGTETITLHGVEALHGVTHTINSDRLDAGTFLCAAAATRGEVFVEHITKAELGGIATVLVEAGLGLEETGGGVHGACSRRPRAVEVTINPFPEFPTDLQPPLATVLATAEGTSSLHETIFNNRLQYVPELQRMGADIASAGQWSIRIRGVERLHGAEIAGHNIRDGAALVVAALGAEGESIVSGRHYVARGYEDLEARLRALGATIEVQ